MTDVSNKDLMDVLLDIRGDIGTLQANVANSSEAFAAHVASDERLHDGLRQDLTAIQLGNARQRGFLTALTSVGSVLGAGIGYAVQKFISGGHH